MPHSRSTGLTFWRISVRKDYDIVGSYDNQRIVSINAERTVNLFEYIDPQGKRPKSLLSTSGLVDTELNFTPETGGARAASVSPRVDVFQLFGATVFLINGNPPNLAANRIGQVASNKGYAKFEANSNQILLVDGSKGYVYDYRAPQLGLRQITDTSFPVKPIDATFLDGFGVVANGDTKDFNLSSFEDFLVWGPANLSFTTNITTDKLTVSSTNNFATGVPVTFSVTGTQDLTFTADPVTDLFDISPGNTDNLQTGIGVTVSNSGGALPTTTPQIVAGTTYYVRRNNATTFYLATTLDNAISGPIIDITGSGSGTNTVHITAQLPYPLNTSDTYYVIRTSETELQVATSLDNAYSNVPIFIDLKTIGNFASTQMINSLGQLQQGSITSQPGNIVACRTLHRRLFLFSRNFTEVWENAGIGSNLPFRRNNSLLMEVGTPSVASIAVGFDRMFFLSQDSDGLGSVMEVRGSESAPVSNRALDYQLAQYASDNTNGITHVSDADGILIKENGLIFYRLNFTLANHTFVYNSTLSTQDNLLWHEEEILNGDRHPAQTHVFYKGNNYYGHYSQPKFYKVDPTVSTNDGESIRRMRIGKPIAPEGYNRLRIDRFHLDVLQGALESDVFDESFLETDSGEALLTDNGENILLDQQVLVDSDQNPLVFFSYSKDGGQSYGNILTSTMGKVGQRTYRTVWRKLGVIPRGQSFTPKVEFYNKIPFIVLGAAWDFEILPE